MPDFGRWNSNGGDPSLNEINRTDQFLDALASQQPAYTTDHDEAELANLLAGWRDDVRETPTAELVTTDEAARMLDRGSIGHRRRFSLAVVGSAAAAVLCLGGFGALVGGAGPGDALYGLRTMFVGEQTTRDDAVILAAQTEMAQVQQLIDQGDWQAAQNKLETITTTVATVNDFERKEELVTQWQELTVKVEAQDAAATVAPGEPLPVFPDVPVVDLDPATVPDLQSDMSVTVQTTIPTETVSSPGTTPPSGTPPSGTSAASETALPSESAPPSGTTATSRAASSASATPSTTAAPSTSASPATTAAPSTTTTRSPAATTSTSVAAQSSAASSSPTVVQSSAAAPSSSPTVARSSAPVSSSPAAAVPSPTATPVPTPTATEGADQPASSPAQPPTTTTLIEEP